MGRTPGFFVGPLVMKKDKTTPTLINTTTAAAIRKKLVLLDSTKFWYNSLLAAD